MLYQTLLSVLALPTAQAAPALHRLTKRHSDCWGSNLQGCSYSTAGYSGAAVSVSLARMYELKIRKSVHVLLSELTYWHKAEMQRMVSRLLAELTDGQL